MIKIVEVWTDFLTGVNDWIFTIVRADEDGYVTTFSLRTHELSDLMRQIGEKFEEINKRINNSPKKEQEEAIDKVELDEILDNTSKEVIDKRIGNIWDDFKRESKLEEK